MIPKIKPLEWEEAQTLTDRGMVPLWVAPSILGRFTVRDGSWYLTPALAQANCRDDETAKAAAEAYYQSLIRSTLE